MTLKDEFRKMTKALAERFRVPPIADVYFPPFRKGGQPKDAQFMALCLEGGATGIGYVLLPDERMEAYTALEPTDFKGRDPQGFALEFGFQDPVKEMIGLAAVNAICQHVMRETRFPVDTVSDPLGLLSVVAGDRVGMVGLFLPLTKTIRKVGAELVIIEKKEPLIEKYPDLPITTDPSKLATCDKVLCTSTTLLNNSLEEILLHCSPGAFVSVIGPTAGYFPDPLFARGVDVVGGRVVRDGPLFLERLAQRKRWGDATDLTCFQKATYRSLL